MTPFSCAFVCSSLEPGRDGVGDYSRVLGGELLALGHRICLISLNDHFIETVQESGGALPMLRLPSGMPWETRVETARRFLEKNGVDWISFQFVSYGFHPKGLIHHFQNYSRTLAQGRKVHLMFHELWIGAENNAPLKNRLVGFLQKKLILQWIHRIKPVAIQTTNHSYIYLLGKNRVTAQELPLFGNILINPVSSNWASTEFSKLGVSAATRNDFWIFGLFGGIPPEWQPFDLFQQLLPIAARQNKQIIFASIGRNGSHGNGILTEAQKRFEGRIQFLNLGEQSEARVSEFLSAIDFGIATCPRSLRGKSSAVATMLEHGLPVILNRDDIHYGSRANPSEDPQLIFPDSDLERRLLQAKRRAPQSRRWEIADKFATAVLGVT